jgi:putative membrane protein
MSAAEQPGGSGMKDAPPADPRTTLAGERTDLANFRTAIALDRTTLAWIRTTLTMGSFGFGMIGFFRALHLQAKTEEAAQMHRAAIRLGELLIIAGLVATVLAAFSHWSTLRRMERGELPRAARWPVSIAVALFVALLGGMGLWKLLG